jgi:hypothetical protein
MIKSKTKELSNERHIEIISFKNYDKQPKTIILKTIRGVEWEILNLSKDVGETNLCMRPYKKMNGFSTKCKFSSEVLGVDRVIDFSNGAANGDVFVCYDVPGEFDLTIAVVIFPFTEPILKFHLHEQKKEQHSRIILIGGTGGGDWNCCCRSDWRINRTCYGRNTWSWV